MDPEGISDKGSEQCSNAARARTGQLDSKANMQGLDSAAELLSVLVYLLPFLDPQPGPRPMKATKGGE
jgi:hypothetical protein